MHNGSTGCSLPIDVSKAFSMRSSMLSYLTGPSPWASACTLRCHWTAVAAPTAALTAVAGRSCARVTL